MHARAYYRESDGSLVDTFHLLSPPYSPSLPFLLSRPVPVFTERRDSDGDHNGLCSTLSSTGFASFPPHSFTLNILTQSIFEIPNSSTTMQFPTSPIFIDSFLAAGFRTRFPVRLHLYHSHHFTPNCKLPALHTRYRQGNCTTCA